MAASSVSKNASQVGGGGDLKSPSTKHFFMIVAVHVWVHSVSSK